MKILKGVPLTTIALIGLAVFGTIVTKADGLTSGADISILDEVEQNGATYRSSGTQRNPPAILEENDADYVRLRLWVGSYNAGDNAYGTETSDLNRTLRLAGRAKDKSLKVLLDFHYSDFWVGPGKQGLPKA